MPQFTLSGAVANACLCGHVEGDHDEKEGCTRQVEGYDGLGTCPCPRYKEAGLIQHPEIEQEGRD